MNKGEREVATARQVMMDKNEGKASNDGWTEASLIVVYLKASLIEPTSAAASFFAAAARATAAAANKDASLASASRRASACVS
jgi:hypothetical protein